MTDVEQTKTPAEEMAEQIKNAMGQSAQVNIAPHVIPPHVASNLLEFLRRVKSEGMEAIAWVEAYSFVQQHAPQQAPQPGVPFGGLPKKE